MSDCNRWNFFDITHKIITRLCAAQTAIDCVAILINLLKLLNIFINEASLNAIKH